MSKSKTIALIFFVFGCSLLFYMDKTIRDDKIYQAYLYYVSHNYMPNQKKMTGKWPVDLSGFEIYVTNTNEFKNGPRRVSMVLDFHKEYHPTINIVSESGRECTFTLSSPFGQKNLRSKTL